MAIEIEILTDTAKAERGLENLADGMEDVERRADDAQDGLEDLERAVKDAGDSGKELDRDLTRALEDVQSEARETGNKVGKELDDGFDKAKRGADDFKDEAQQSAREGAASFSGEFDDVGDYIQEVLANALSGFGPVGAAAGIAAAVGVGVLVSKLEEANEAAEATRERVNDLADELYEAGGDLSQVDMAGVWKDLISSLDSVYGHPWAQRTIDGWDAIRIIAEETGLSVEEVFKAFQDPSGPEGLELARLAAEELGTGLGRTIGAADETTAAWQLFNSVAGETSTLIEDATAKSDTMTESLQDQEQSVEQLRDALEETADAYRDNIDAQIAYHEQLEKTNETLKENGATTDLTTEAGRENVAAINDQAEANAELLDSMAANGASAEDIRAKWSQLRQELFDQAVQAGYTREEAQELIDTYLGTPTQVDTRFTSNADRAEREAADYNDEVNSTPSEVNTDVNFNASSVDAQAAVNNAMARVVRPIVKVRFVADGGGSGIQTGRI